jgi:hypothetical protein
MVEPIVCTTLPKVDEVGTSLVAVPTAQALVARPESMAPNDNLANDDSGLPNSTTAESEIVCRMSSWLYMYWPDPGKLDYPVWYYGWSSFHDP